MCSAAFCLLQNVVINSLQRKLQFAVAFRQLSLIVMHYDAFTPQTCCKYRCV